MDTAQRDKQLSRNFEWGTGTITEQFLNTRYYIKSDKKGVQRRIDVPQPKHQERQKAVLSPTPASVRQKSHLILIKLV